MLTTTHGRARETILPLGQISPTISASSTVASPHSALPLPLPSPFLGQDETQRLRKLKLSIALLITVAMLPGMVGVIREIGGSKYGWEGSDMELGREIAWP